MKKELEKLLEEVKTLLNETDEDLKKKEKETKEKFKKAIDKSSVIVAFVMDPNESGGALIMGQGIEVLSCYGMLTEALIKQTDKELVEKAFESALEEIEGEVK